MKRISYCDVDILAIICRKPKTSEEICASMGWWVHGHVRKRLKVLTDKGLIFRKLQGKFYIYFSSQGEG